MINLEKNQKEVMSDMLSRAGSTDKGVALKAQAEFARGIEMPLRSAVLSGDIVTNLFTNVDYTGTRHVEYPLDIVAPGEEDEYRAYVIPDEGRIPERRANGSYLMIPTYEVGNSIDCRLKFLRDANWPVVQRMLQVFEAGVVKKINDDGWQTILAAGLDRNIIINDGNATAGQFTPRLISLLSTIMRRNGGGNSSSINRARLTDLAVSPEAHIDIRSWGLDLIPDAARANIYYANEDNQDLIKIYNVNIMALDELGESQEYQNYYTNELSGTMAASDVEIVVGLDRSREDSFMMPVKEDLQVYEDDTLHRRNLFGIYGRMELGFAVLDSRRVLLGSL